MKKRVPFIEQMNKTECGIACIAMISAYYHHHITLPELRRKMGSGRDGNTLFDLYKAAMEYKFDAKCYKTSIPSLDNIKLPAILYWDNKHYVVLQGIKKGRYSIIDPSMGRRTLNEIEFSEHFSQYVLEMIPGEGFVKRRETGLWKPYIKLLFSNRRMVISLFFFSLLLQFFVLITPYFTQRIVDGLLSPVSSALILMLKGILISFGAYFFFNLIRNEISIRLFRWLDFKMSWEFFTHLLKIPYSFFQVRQSGDLLYRFSYLRTIRDILSNQIIKSVLDGLLLIIITGYMLYKSLYLASYMIGFSILLYLFILILRPFMHEFNRNELSKDTNLYSFQAESITGILNIKTSGSEKQIISRWEDLHRDFSQSYLKKERLFSFMSSFTGGLIYFIPLFLIWVGSYQVMDNKITMGELIAFQTISTYFITTSNSIISSIEAFYQLKVYLRRIRDVLDTEVEETDEQKEEILLEGNIDLCDVSFSYSDYGEPILKNVNVSIKSGEKIAIIGPSGSGKSTLAKMIVGIHQPTSGSIHFENKNFNELNKSHIRRQMGIVSQETFLFNQSIFENIKLNKEDITLEQAAAAASIAQIHSEIMEMPMKYETVISEMGQNLSGGQRQRIAIARALVNQPKVLVLDEATNALDSINEKKIDEYLSAVNCTRIIIAHRLSSIKDANQIFILNKGQIVGKGTHDELINHNVFYKQLFTKNEQLDLKGGEQNEQRFKGYEKSVL